MATANIRLIFAITFLATFVVSANMTCSSKFKGKCLCGLVPYEDRLKYVVNCTDTGFQNTDVLEFLPEETEVVIFTGNYIPELPWNLFGALNDLHKLTVVDMSNNHIREIRGKTYHRVQNVRRLILNHNNLTIAREDGVDDLNHHHPRVFSNFENLMELHLTNAFADNTSAALSRDLHDIFVNSNLKNLVKLHLEQNEISSFIDRRVFCDLPSLRDLHLGDNLLNELNFNVLCLKNLRFLDLERNNFTSMKLHDLMTLDAVLDLPNRVMDTFVIDLTYNPFICDCPLTHLHDWLSHTLVEVRNKEHLTCSRPDVSKFEDNREEYVQLYEAAKRCRAPASVSHRGKGITESNIIFVFMLIAVMVLSLVLIGYFSRWWHTGKLLARLLGYSTIENEQPPEVHV